MDLANIKQSDTTTVELKLPNAEETPLLNPDGSPMSIEVYGSFSDQYRSIIDAQQNLRIKKASKNGGKVTFSAEEVRENRMALAVGCVKSWNITFNGKCPECTPDNVRQVFSEYPFIRLAVEMAIETPDNFLESSSKN